MLRKTRDTSEGESVLRRAIHRVAAWPLLLIILLSVTGAGCVRVPPNFRTPQVFFEPTLQVSRFVGQLSDKSNWGMGVGMTQGAKFNRVGVAFSITTDYFLTTQNAPPASSGMQITTARLLGRYFLPFGLFQPFTELAVARVGFISNALVQSTGINLSSWAVGGSLGARYELGDLFVEGIGTWDYLLEVDDTSVFSIVLAVGLRALLE